MKQRSVLVVVLLAVGALVGGCTSGGDDATGSGGGAADRLSAERADRGQHAQVTLAPRDRAVVYTATLTVRVTDAAKARREATSIVTDARGYVARERTSTDPDDEDGPTGRLTLKIPVDRYPAVLHQLSTKLGDRVSLKRRARDVTKKVADVDSRVKSARATIDRLRVLLGKADAVGEVLKVEKRLSKREADLEALEARQKALDAKTNYATVTLRLQAPPAAAPAEHAGFVSGLLAGWAAFRAMVGWLLTVFGAVAPFVVIFGAVAYGIWRSYRFVRRRRSPVGSSD